MELDTGSLWMAWSAEPGSVVLLVAIEGAYLLGVGPLRERNNWADDVDPRQVATFTLGILILFLALVSPIDVVSDNYLFSVHMLQHVLLTLVAPPLMVRGLPDWLIRPLLRPNWSFRTARALTHPIGAFLSFNLIFSLWHFPALYDASLSNEVIHVVEHVMMISTAMLMWWPLTSTMPELPRVSYPMRMMYLFGLSIAQIIVFGALTFAGQPLYQHYVDAPRISTLSALTDQQIGAVIMKVGGGMLFLGLLVVTFYRWYGEEERQRQANKRLRLGLPEDSSPELEDTPR